MNITDWKHDVAQMRDVRDASDPLTITTSALAAELELTFVARDWFHSCVADSRKVTVYVTRMGADVFASVPYSRYEYPIDVAFADYLTAGDKYGTGGSGVSLTKECLSGGE